MDYIKHSEQSKDFSLEEEPGKEPSGKKLAQSILFILLTTFGQTTNAFKLDGISQSKNVVDVRGICTENPLTTILEMRKILFAIKYYESKMEDKKAHEDFHFYFMQKIKTTNRILSIISQLQAKKNIRELEKIWQCVPIGEYVNISEEIKKASKE